MYGFAGTIQDQITAAAGRYSVPSWLALAVAQRESGFNQGAIGTSGERGVFQLMPGTARDLGVNPSDLDQNIDGGVRYLSQLFQRFGDWHTALEAYNGGQGNVARGTVSSAARNYADAILGETPPDFGVSWPSEAPYDYGTGESAGLSGLAIAGLGLAAAAVLWAILD